MKPCVFARPVALITGTSSGLGMMAAVALAREGYHVAATMRNLERKDRLCLALRDAGAEAHADILPLDVTDEEQIHEAVQTVIHRYGRIDLLVNNAGYAAGGFVEETSLAEWRRQFETNFFGAVAVTKAVLPHMRKRRQGTIINISSVSGRIGFPGLGPYAASKFALEGFSEALRLEMLPFGIRVVLIEPGAFRTEIWSKGMEAAQVMPDSPYGQQMSAIRKSVEHAARTAQNPEPVMEAVLKAAKSPHPPLRYPVGKGVRAAIWLKELLPWKWVETIVSRKMKG